MKNNLIEFKIFLFMPVKTSGDPWSIDVSVHFRIPNYNTISLVLRLRIVSADDPYAMVSLFFRRCYYVSFFIETKNKKSDIKNLKKPKKKKEKNELPYARVFTLSTQNTMRCVSENKC